MSIKITDYIVQSTVCRWHQWQLCDK